MSLYSARRLVNRLAMDPADRRAAVELGCRREGAVLAGARVAQRLKGDGTDRWGPEGMDDAKAGGPVVVRRSPTDAGARLW